MYRNVFSRCIGFHAFILYQSVSVHFFSPLFLCFCFPVLWHDIHFFLCRWGCAFTCNLAQAMSLGLLASICWCPLPFLFCCGVGIHSILRRRIDVFLFSLSFVEIGWILLRRLSYLLLLNYPAGIHYILHIGLPPTYDKYINWDKSHQSIFAVWFYQINWKDSEEFSMNKKKKRIIFEIITPTYVKIHFERGIRVEYQSSVLKSIFGIGRMNQWEIERMGARTERKKSHSQLRERIWFGATMEYLISLYSYF